MSSGTKGAQAFLMMSIIGSLFGLYYYGISLSTIGVIILGYFMYGCLGVVVTYHRYLTHKSYQTHPFLIKLFSVLGCFGGTGSPLAWVAIHLNHHLKSDKPNDPHSPHYKGLRIFALEYEHEVDSNTKWRMRDLIVDPFQQFLHRYYFLIIAAWSVTLYFIGGLYLVIFLHWAPAVVTAIMSNVVNYIGHKPNWIGSYRTYNLNDHSANNWIFAIPSWGETWHNNHHRHPKNYSCGQRWWEFDISALIIKLIKT
jgi:stearoyl-CoA desaturase (delta-9 desaturase)